MLTTEPCRESLMSLPAGAIALFLAGLILFLAYYTGDRDRGDR